MQKNQQPLTLNTILVAALIIAAFFIGSLLTKVSYLEKSGSSTTNDATAKSLGQGVLSNQPQAPDAQAPSGKIKPVTDKDYIRGNKDAKITLVEYSDLECPFCKRFHPTMQEILKTYGDKVRWVYRHFPLSFHANAQKEDEASECVAGLGGNDRFWEYIDKIFERTTSNGTGFALDQLGPLAEEVGVDKTQFQSCLDSGKYTQHVKDGVADGTSGGVNGTPSTFIIGGKGDSEILVGAQPIDAFKAAIDEALK